MRALTTKVAHAMPTYEIIAVQFRDIQDVNGYAQSKTFYTRAFRSGDEQDKAAAKMELWEEARRHGFTTQEIVKVRQRIVYDTKTMIHV